MNHWPDWNLALVNGAYVRAIEAENAEEVVSRGMELIEGQGLSSGRAGAAAARERGAIFTRTAPAGWALQIPDLASRLRALPAVELGPPDDVLLRAVLVKLFADRQLAVEENLVGYLSVRIERSFAAAQHIVQRLDDEALRRQRPVSRVMAAEIMISEQP